MRKKLFHFLELLLMFLVGVVGATILTVGTVYWHWPWQLGLVSMLVFAWVWMAVVVKWLLACQ